MIRAACLTAAFLAAPASAAPGDLGRYESTGVGPVNTWWVETPGRGLVVVDAQRDAASATAAIMAIQQSGLPVRAILITHPHPDHVAGLRLFKQAFGAAVIAGRGSAAEFAADRQGLLALEGAQLPPAPDRLVGDGERFTIDGLAIEAREVGPGESIAGTLYHLPRQRLLFSADLATPGLVPFVAEGRTAEWRAQLATLSTAYPRGTRLAPGHGPAGALPDLVQRADAWLRAYRLMIGRAIRPGSPGGAQVTPAEQAAIDRDMASRFRTRGQVAGLPPGELERVNARAVARELAGVPPRPPLAR